MPAQRALQLCRMQLCQRLVKSPAPLVRVWQVSKCCVCCSTLTIPVLVSAELLRGECIAVSMVLTRVCGEQSGCRRITLEVAR